MKHLRLLPFVMALGIGLLLVKGAGLVMDARAADAGTAPATTAADATTAAGTSSDPAGDDAETASAGEVDVLTSLAKRRATLDAREQDLVMQANLIAAAEKRVDDKITQLKALQTQMQTLMGQRDAAEQAQLNAIVKTYSSMKSKDAARIFNTLDDDVLLSVAQAMKPDVLGAIMANMQADAAQKLTVRLANRLKPPAPAPVPQQLATLTPPAATPGSMTAAAPATQAPAAPENAPAMAPSLAAPIPAPAKAAAAPAPSSPQQTASNTPLQSPASTAPQTAAPAKK
jgi:flagellar motility protein MotE (MotC chaperone)